MMKKRIALLILIFLSAVMLCGCQNERPECREASELNNSDAVIASWSGAPSENALKTYFPKAAHLITDDSIALLIENLNGKKVDAVLSAKVFFDSFPDKNGLKTLDGDFGSCDYGFFFVQNEKGKRLRDEMNEFIDKAGKSGLQRELEDLWLSENAAGRPIGTGSDDPDAPELVFAVEYQSPPFGYVEGNKCIGFDVDYADCFCREYGYRLKVVGLPYTMLAAGDTTGGYDMAGGGLIINEELKQIKTISEPNCSSSFVVVIRDGDAAASSSFSLTDSLRHALLEDNRWQMYLNGLLTTLLITAVSAAAGTLLGFAVYLTGLNAGKVFRRTVGFIFSVLQITPIIVLLMIFYYIVFHGISISGLGVSIAVFTLIMAGSVYGAMTASVGTIEHGQTEGALALGCTASQTFFRVVMPQAMRHFLPLYRGIMVDLIKLTSVVGYIAVQDLTKVADIVRSRTFDAFTPLFLSAIVYILLALLMIWAVNTVCRATDPKRRNRERILSGLEEEKEAVR